MMMASKNLVTLLFAGSLIVAMLVFWPSLSGPLVFDDYVVLIALGEDGGVTDFNKLLVFVTSFASTPGRPLSMLSFLLNDQYWPTVPWSFKYTNLLIHLLNGVLVFVLAQQLARLMMRDETRVLWIALGTMALWVFHPMQLSTMMLVVQRMTQLMTLFSLLGLICYVHGRVQTEQRLVRSYSWMTLGIGFFGVLSVLSKENGILICLLALVLEITLLSAGNVKKPRYWHTWSGIFLIAPMILLLTVMASGYTQDAYNHRSFTLIERLLTQPRILFDYLSNILLPRLNGSGIFHDDYPVSKGLLNPPTTLVFAILLLGGGLFALAKRHRYPILAFAILWFLASHIIESTILPLELYFEHRNYLSMVGIAFSSVCCIMMINGFAKRPLLMALTIFITLQIFMSYQSSRVWGNEEVLANIWAIENPTSIRAQQGAAGLAAERGNFKEAKRIMKAALKYYPENLGLLSADMVYSCLLDEINQDQIDYVIQQASTAEYSLAFHNEVRYLREYAISDICSPLDIVDVEKLVDATLRNPIYKVNKKSEFILLSERAFVAIEKNQLFTAMSALDSAYNIVPDIKVALGQAILLKEAGLYDDALHYIDVARNTKNSWRDYFLYAANQQRIKSLEQAILEAQAESKLNTDKN